MSAASRPWYKRIPPALWGLVALGVGMTLGTLYPEQLGFVGAGMKAGFRGLATAAPFIIFFTIFAAVSNMMGQGKAGALAFWVTLVFTGLGLLGGFIAIIMLVPFFSLPLGGGAGAAGFLSTLAAQTGNLIHSSQALLAVIFAAVTAVLIGYGKRWKATRWFCEPTERVVRFIGVDGINAAGRILVTAFPFILFGLGIFIPTAIGDAIAKTNDGVSGTAFIQSVVGTDPVALYFLSVGIQVLILGTYIAVVSAIALWYTKFPVRAFFRDYFAITYSFAWATSSSAASIPVTLERTGNGLKVRKEIRDFVVPLGATMNLDGALVASFVITALASMLVGYYPTAFDLLLLLIPLKIVTMGVPGIPGGIATVVPAVAAEILPLPPGVGPTFLAIWVAFSVGLSDQFRTGVSTVTNGIVALAFEKAYPKYFMKKGALPAVDDAAALPADA